MKWLEEHPEEALALETKLRNELLANPEKVLAADIAEKMKALRA